MEYNIKMTDEERKGASKLEKAWREEAEKLKEIYSEFNLKNACKNPLFLDLLKSGTSVKRAYETACIDEIKDYIERKTEARIMEFVRQNGSRPKENGTSAGKGGLGTTPVENMTKEERASIAKKVAAGEKITLSSF